jgi:hypothetical protein
MTWLKTNHCPPSVRWVHNDVCGSRVYFVTGAIVGSSVSLPTKQQLIAGGFLSKPDQTKQSFGMSLNDVD